MPINLIDKIKPKNNGTFAMVDAEDVELSGGIRLDAKVVDIESRLPVALTQEEYDALDAAGKVNPNTPYIIIEGAAK